MTLPQVSLGRRGLLAAGGLALAGVAGCRNKTPTPEVVTPATSASQATPSPTATQSASTPASSSSAPASSSSAATPTQSPWPAGKFEVTKSLNTPWSIAFINGSALVTQRDTGNILRITPKGNEWQTQDLGVVPGIEHGGEGGLLGLTGNDAGDLYCYRTTPEDNRVEMIAPQSGGGWKITKSIVTGIPRASNHNGGRIVLRDDGRLYIGTGDAANKDSAQDKQSLAGKILRVDLAQGKAEMVSYGHRNVQGLGWMSDGRMFASEFGPTVDDELNFIQEGRNYGWPMVTGARTSGGSAKAIHVWPSTADASPSAIAIVGNLCFVACLRGQRLYRLTLPEDGAEFDGGGKLPMKEVLNLNARLRDVVVTPDQKHLWIATNEDDKSRIVQVAIEELRG